MQPESYRQRLAEIVGAENVAWDPEHLRARGWEGPLPQAVVHPPGPEQVVEVIKLACAERLKVSPAGALTKQRMGGVSRQIDLVLSLDRLNRVTDYEPADLTVTVQAGLPIRGLDAALRAQGQMLPFDAPFAAEATVGGVLATNGSGARRLRYGTSRDMLLGVRFVTAEGKLVKSGGKVVKNVAGYDMGKMLLGSFGTLGVITEVTFKVFPVLPCSMTLLLGFPTAPQALQARHRILNSPFAPQALDMVDAAAGALAGEPVLSAAPFTLLVAMAGPEPAIERACRELPSLLRPDGWEKHSELTGDAEQNLWKKIQELTPAVLRAHPEAAVVKASVLLSRIGDLLEQARQAASRNGLTLATLARAGTGVVYCYLLPQPKTNGVSQAERTAKACEALLSETDRLGGRAVVEWAPPAAKEMTNLWGPLRDDFPVMQRLKEQFDPQAILNPGRFYGGI
ncbi:MAG: FAD-binding oxidoreductase [Acidobacteria bacterium]|nr:FAD-binding oxidoreductase [Acidobacteriota bacterium]